MVYESWKQIANVTISNPVNQTNFQHKLSLTWKTGMAADFSDIRFTQSNGTICTYFIESYTPGVSAEVCITVPDANQTSLILYYENASATSESTSSVFIVYDDFEDGDVSGWTIEAGTFVADASIKYSGSYSGKFTHSSTYGYTGVYKAVSLTSGIIEYTFRTNVSNAHHIPPTFCNGAFSDLKNAFFIFIGNGYIGYSDAGGNLHNLITYAASTWYTVKLVVKSLTAYDIYVNGALLKEDAPVRGTPTSWDRLFFGAYSSGIITWIDNIKVRKYAATEPTLSVGGAVKNTHDLKLVSPIKITVGGKSDFIYNQATIKRSASDLSTTAGISIPVNALSYVQNNQEVSIEYKNRVLFHGVTADWTLSFSNGLSSIDIPCIDYSYKLSHTAVTVDEAVTFEAGTVIGSIIVALASSVGIDTTRVQQDDDLVLTDDLVVAVGEMALDIIQTLCSDYQCVFYLDYGKVGGTIYTYAVFGNYEYIKELPAFLETHLIEETNLITFSLSLKSVPDAVCTRVIATRTISDVVEVGVAVYGDAPYYDKVVEININDTSDIDDLAESYLANFRRVDTQLTGSFQGMGMSLFNILDISGLSRLTGKYLDLTHYRVTDISYTLSNLGITADITGIDPDAELWDEGIRKASGERSIDRLIESEAATQAENAKPVYATVIA